MNISIFVLGVERSVADPLFHTMLENTFSQQLNEGGEIEYYPSVKEASSSVSKAFSNSDAVLFFVEPRVYSSVKKIIAKAFKLSLVKNTILLEKASSFATPEMKADEFFEDTHALVPEKGKVFCPADGLFSGFCSVRGKQCMMFLPYLAEKASTLLSQQAIPFLNSMYSQSLPTCYSEHIFARLIKEDLEKEPVSIAIANTKTVELFSEYISDFPVCVECVKKTPRSEERGAVRPADYVANLSIAAAEFLGVPYGISLSNAYYLDENSKDKLTVFMAVTNDLQTTVREVNSLPWESGSDFIRRCCGELCLLLHNIIQSDRHEGVHANPKEEKKVFRLRTAIAIVGAVTILLGAAGAYYFSAHGYSLKDWAQKYLPQVFTQQFLPEGEAESQAPLPDESSSESRESELQSSSAEAVSEADSTLPVSENRNGATNL